MNRFRTWLADMVTGGDYSRAEAGWNRCKDAYVDVCQESFEFRLYWKEAEEKLERIAAEEKPTSNSTVKRICRIARGEE